MKERHLIVMGGGGFSEEPHNPLLDNYLIDLAGGGIPRICFLPTASGDSQAYIDKFQFMFPPERAETTILGLFRREDIVDPGKHLLNQDIIYVGGGNTANMLAVWRVHGIDKTLREVWEKGIILAGISAGMNCWFEECVTDSFGGHQKLQSGLGFLAGSCCPHYQVPERKEAYRRFVYGGELSDGVAAENSVALHYVGEKLFEAVSSVESAQAWRVMRRGEKIVEESIQVRFLGGRRQD